MHMCVQAYSCKCNTHGGQKKTPDALELELQVAVSHLMWVLGT